MQEGRMNGSFATEDIYVSPHSLFKHGDGVFQENRVIMNSKRIEEELRIQGSGVGKMNKCNSTSVAWGKRIHVHRRGPLNQPRIHKGCPSSNFRSDARTRINSAPGPGSYVANSKYTRPSTPAFSFGIPLSSPLLDMASTPGPGSYTMKSKPLGPSFSITRREQGFKCKDIPGPGAYHAPRNAAMDGPSFSIGARLTPPSRSSESPGPGSYSLKPRPSGPHYSITGRISPSRSDEGPGPGTYSQSSRASSPAFSIYGKPHDLKLPVEVPGPGTYTLPCTREGPFFSLLGRISPLPELNSTNPGPGNYASPSGRAETPAFSFGRRVAEGNSTSSREQSPGPGEYEVRMSPATPSFSFGGKPLAQQLHLRPGSGSYDTSIRLRSHRPSSSCSSQGSSFPVPGSYNPQQKPRQGPAFIIKGKIDMPLRVDTPDPGAYRPTMDLIVASSAKLRYGSKPNSPNTGTYKLVNSSLQSRSDSPAFSFGSRIYELIRNKVPGPGTYYDFNYNASGPSFSITGRPARFNLGCNPGPGSYDDHLYITGNNGPFFSLLGKIVTKQRDTSPGPGAYKPRLPPDGPSFSIYGRISPMVNI